MPALKYHVRIRVLTGIYHARAKAQPSGIGKRYGNQRTCNAVYV